MKTIKLSILLAVVCIANLTSAKPNEFIGATSHSPCHPMDRGDVNRQRHMGKMSRVTSCLARRNPWVGVSVIGSYRYHAHERFCSASNVTYRDFAIFAFHLRVLGQIARQFCSNQPTTNNQN